MEKAFIPTPGQFLAWCKPSAEDLGLPPLHEAFKSAILINRKFENYRPVHEPTALTIQDAISSIGSERFRSMNESDARKAFKEAYAVSIDLYARGVLQSAPKQLHDDSAESIEQRKKDALVLPQYKKTTAQQSLAEMRRKLGIKK